MALDYITDIAFTCGFTPEYIQKKVEEAKEVAKENKVDFSKPVLIGYDVQGPMVRTTDEKWYTYPNLQTAISTIGNHPDVYKALISGWDLSTLRYFRDRRLGIDMGIIGELGAAFEYDKNVYIINPATKEHYKFIEKVLEVAGENEIKIAIQGNLSTRVNCIYFEGDEPDRGGLKEHFLVKERGNITINDLYKHLPREYFSLKGDKLEFEINDKTIRSIDEVLRVVYPLRSVRVSKDGNKISLWIDERDDRSFTLEEMEKLGNEINKELEGKWELDPNPDYCIDFIYKGDGFETSKENTAHLLARKLFGEEYIITNVGDKKGDVLKSKNTIFFPLIGTQAEKYCEENGIPYVSVVNAVDYSLILAELINENRKRRKEDLNIIELKIEKGDYMRD